MASSMTSRATMADDLRDIARNAERMAERLDRRNGDKPLAIDQFFDLTVAGARLYASRAKGGQWWYYLTLPPGARPVEDRGWLYNEPGGGYFWYTGSADDEDGALRKGLIKLLETEFE